MTHRAQLAILLLVLVLLALAILLPRPAASDAPAAASRIPASEFVPVGSAGSLSGLSTPGAPFQSRTTGAAIGPTFTAAPQGALPGGQRPATPSPSAPRPVSVAPVSRHPVGRQSASSGETPATGPTAPSVAGQASWMPERYGARYLALPAGPGHRVRICGAGGCAVMTSNDSGPDRAMQRAGRVADIGVLAWEAICGLPRSAGPCRVTVTPWK